MPALLVLLPRGGLGAWCATHNAAPTRQVRASTSTSGMRDGSPAARASAKVPHDTPLLLPVLLLPLVPARAENNAASTVSITRPSCPRIRTRPHDPPAPARAPRPISHKAQNPRLQTPAPNPPPRSKTQKKSKREKKRTALVPLVRRLIMRFTTPNLTCASASRPQAPASAPPPPPPPGRRSNPVQGPERPVQRRAAGAGAGEAIKRRTPTSQNNKAQRTTHHRMRRHVKQEKVVLPGAEDALVDEALGEALAHLLELEADLEDVPGFACGGWRLVEQLLPSAAVIARSGSGSRFYPPPQPDLGHRQRTGSFVPFNVILKGELVVATKSRLALMPESGPRSDVSRASFKCVLEGRKEGRKYYFNRSDPMNIAGPGNTYSTSNVCYGHIPILPL
ncbi:hypothetical protein DFH09DRAFT_1080128 [Mycena vulgaris]|nr:hypothetical protein DFH09DRAFT_1080128 [Mycena vulgaris]